MPDLVRVSLGEVVCVAVLAAIGSQALRIVIAAVRAEPGTATSPWRRFRRLGSLVATIGGVIASVSTAVLALLLIPALLIAAAIGAGFTAAVTGQDEVHIDGTPFLVLLVVAAVAFVASLRLSRRLKRRIAAAVAPADGTPRAGSWEGRVGVAALTTATVAVWAVAVGGVPSWADAPSRCDQDGFPSIHEPLGRAPADPPAGEPATVAAALDVDLPLELHGLEGADLEVVPTLDGGVELRYVGGTHLRPGQLRAAIAESLERDGHRGASVVIERPDQWPPVVRHRWSSADGTGVIEVRECGGTRTPDEVASLVRVGPDRLGHCAPVDRRALCAAIYDAADIVLGEPGPHGPERVAARGEAPSGPLASVVGADGHLVLDQPAVDFPLDRRAERRDVLERLEATGWTWQPERFDLGNGIVAVVDESPYDRLGGEVTFRRVVGGIGLWLVADIDLFGATLRITTDSLV